jgi:hypothetical protein
MVLVQANGRDSPHDRPFYRLRNTEAPFEIALNHFHGSGAGEWTRFTA